MLSNSKSLAGGVRSIGSLLVGLAMLLAGCQKQDQIVHYTVPKPPPIDAPRQAAATAGGAAATQRAGAPARMLAAIVLVADLGWFFKLTGPPDAVAQHSEQFTAFVKSLNFSTGNPRWTMPEGWQEQPASGIRHATISIPAEPTPLELSVTKLPIQAASETEFFLANINRWRGQMSLPPIAESDLKAQSKRVSLDRSALLATVVDLVGTTAAGGMGRAPFAGTDKPATETAPVEAKDRMLAAIASDGDTGWFFKLAGPKDAVTLHVDSFKAVIASLHFATGKPQWTLPSGWIEQPASGIRYATLVIPGEPKPLELSVTRLPRSGDESTFLLSNINRWRGQMTLPPMIAADLPDSSKRIPLAAEGAIATMVDLEGTLTSGGMGRGPFSQGAGSGN